MTRGPGLRSDWPERVFERHVGSVDDARDGDGVGTEDRMEHDGLDKLRAYLAGLAGGSCTLPFERMRELIGRGLPEAATSPAWWTDPDGWHTWPASGACRTAGWRLESNHAGARLVRLERIRDDTRGD